jgi:hypothetical protein
MSKTPRKAEDNMKADYDFTNGVRGKFYREAAVLVPLVHLETDVLKYLQDRAVARGTTRNALVIELFEVVR